MFSPAGFSTSTATCGVMRIMQSQQSLLIQNFKSAEGLWECLTCIMDIKSTDNKYVACTTTRSTGFVSVPSVSHSKQETHVIVKQEYLKLLLFVSKEHKLHVQWSNHNNLQDMHLSTYTYLHQVAHILYCQVIISNYHRLIVVKYFIIIQCWNINIQSCYCYRQCQSTITV